MATEYLILKAIDATAIPAPDEVIERGTVARAVTYDIMGRTTASGALSAIREVCPNPDDGVEYVAVPVSNWTSLRPKVKIRDPIIEWVETSKRAPRQRRPQGGGES